MSLRAFQWLKLIVAKTIGNNLYSRLGRSWEEFRRRKQRSRHFEGTREAFLARGGSIDRLYPILTDFEDVAGTASGHYFHQDLLVAQLIFERSPVRHIDVGSRIDGFVAHVASYRPIEILDIRALSESEHPNISFLKRDLMRFEGNDDEIADSISCLHAIEHFGLGRYGDTVDPSGHLIGYRNVVRMLKPGGQLYISFPIGRKNEVHFNAHRVFHPLEIFEWPIESGELVLKRFDYVDDRGSLHFEYPILETIPEVDYGCGIYTFEKLSSSKS